MAKRGRKPHLTLAIKHKILQRVAETTGKKNKTEISQEFNISPSTVYDIVKRNSDQYGNILPDLQKSITIGAGICSNLALNALKNKNLEKEKPKTLAYIAESTGKLSIGMQPSTVIINNTMPTDRDELMRMLNPDKKHITIDNSITIESANNDDDNDNDDMLSNHNHESA